ncbi:MAG: dihydrolipoyl dehydrogenase [Spirochaetota bacterium]
MSNENRKYDIAVLGAGPGGYAAAFMAADLGKKVVLIDPLKNPGGVCLHWGCIPTKALLRVVNLKDEVEESKEWGLKFDNLDIDVKKLVEFKNSVVEKLTGGLGQLVERRKITYLRGHGRFTDDHSIEVTPVDEGSARSVEFENAIIATGTRAATIPGADLESEKILYAKPALDLEEIPKTLLVVGAGYIGLELGSLYAKLGSEVTVVEMLDEIMPGTDRDLIKVFLKANKNTFKELRTGTKVEKIEERKKDLEITFAAKDGEKETVTYERVLMTVGRVPNTDSIGLDKAGLEPGEKGFIEVDEQRRTAVSHIFAIGDITGPPLLAHKANLEGRVAARVAAGEKDGYDPAAIPSVEYTDPEIAWAGITEREAEEQNLDVRVTSFPWGASGRAATLGNTVGKTKLIFDSESGRLLGAGIVGRRADELIPETALAIEMAAVAEDISTTIHPHPTLSETIMEAADAFFGTPTHIMGRKPK